MKHFWNQSIFPLNCIWIVLDQEQVGQWNIPNCCAGIYRFPDYNFYLFVLHLDAILVVIHQFPVYRRYVSVTFNRTNVILKGLLDPVDHFLNHRTSFEMYLLC